MYKSRFEDQTHQVIGGSVGNVVFNGLWLMFFCASEVMCLVILLSWTYDFYGLCLLLFGLFGFAWMISWWSWFTFCAPKRVQFISQSRDGSLVVTRDAPCGEINIPKGAKVRYNCAPGSYRLDLVQRGSAPHGLNIWFEYQRKQFWISEASSNYREGLELFASHAILQPDPKLHGWERYAYWFRLRDHFRERPQLDEVIAEVHRILSRACCIQNN